MLKLPARRPAPLQKPLTILFTDLVDSTRFFRSQGNDAGMELIKRHNRILFPIVKQMGGRVVKTIGDSIFAVFDDPSKGVSCAWAMQKALAQASEGGDQNNALRVRIGVHFGLAMETRGDFFGDAVNIAERVKSKAEAERFASRGLSAIFCALTRPFERDR